jgi:hypothetical protein
VTLIDSPSHLDSPSHRTEALTSPETLSTAVSWGAIVAGAVASAALTLLLLAFGAGMGFTVVSPWSDSGVSSSTFSIFTGLYLLVVAMLASTIGGYLAGRLRVKWAGVHTHEVYFRDTAHGFLAWAFATVLSAAVLGGAAAHVIGGAPGGLVQDAGAAANRGGGPMATVVDALFRPTAGNNAASAPDTAPSRVEVSRLLAGSLREGGDLAPADRTYVAQLVASRTGLSQPDAEKRVSDAITQFKVAADNVRKAAAQLSLWLAASMLLGAFSASLAATEGGHFRDTEWWNEPR